MARAYSEDLRWRVVGAVEAGASCRQAAARFGVSVSFGQPAALARQRLLAAQPVGGQR